MSAGTFTDQARATIYGRTHGRCAGCGAGQVTAQHRRARGMGGTRAFAAAAAANGVALCGSGTTGCHGWTERHPVYARLLGYRLDAGDDPLVEPYFDTALGWRRILPDGGHTYVDLEDLEELDARVTARLALERWLATGRTPSALELALAGVPL